MPNPTLPQVTVFIPAHNAEPYIAEALESILAQTKTDFELLIIDDGSTDATADIVANYAGDSRVRLLTNDRNRGQVVTRNRGLSEARSKYITLMDADDIALPERLAKQVAFLDKHPHIDVVGSQCEVFYSGINTPRSTWAPPCEPDRIAVASLFGHCPLPHSSVTARLDILRKFGYRNGFPAAEDYDLWTRMLAQRRCLACLPERLLLYRQHPAQTTKRYEEYSTSSHRVIVSRLLQALGVDCDEIELDLHLAMYEGRSFHRRLGQPMDRDYLLWARDWLTRISNGNQRSQIYNQQTLDRHLADLWRFSCRKTAREAKTAAGLLYFTSPLSWHGVLAKLHKTRSS